MRPASVSLDCRIRSRAAEPSSRNWARAQPLYTPVIDQAAQHLEQAWQAVDLVEHDQLARLCPQVGVRILQPQSIRRPLQVEVHRPARPISCHTLRQRGLAHLAWPEQHHGGRTRQGSAEIGFGLAEDHP